MYTNQKPFFIRVVTPLHAGTGSDIGIIDMPIQRERHTNFPKIESSGLKGSLREYFETTLKDKKTEIDLVFGPEKNGGEHAAAFALTDASVLFFPVKSAKGVYALITCPSVLKRYNEFCGLYAEKPLKDIDDVKGGNCLVANKEKVSFDGKEVVFEEFAFNVTGRIDDDMKKHFNFVDSERIVCVSDDVFRDFVTLSTELITRNRVDPVTGTVQNGALFSEEFLPPETVLYSFLQTGPVNAEVKDGDVTNYLENKYGPKNTKPFEEGKKEYLKEKYGIDDLGAWKKENTVCQFLTTNFPDVFQIGGDATIGKGLVKIYGIKEEA